MEMLDRARQNLDPLVAQKNSSCHSLKPQTNQIHDWYTRKPLNGVFRGTDSESQRIILVSIGSASVVTTTASRYFPINHV